MGLPNLICEMAPPPLRAAAVARPRVCLVNDDEAVLTSLKFLFKAAGFEVRAFVGGRELLASSSVRWADCFVLDHRPRGIDGLDVARRLRARGVDGPVVLTTGFRCGALDRGSSGTDRAIAVARVDEELIQELMQTIEETRRGRLRKTP